MPIAFEKILEAEFVPESMGRRASSSMVNVMTARAHLNRC
jgi:hypothetical protein